MQNQPESHDGHANGHPIVIMGRGNWIEDVYAESHITYEYSSDVNLLTIVGANRTAYSTSG